MSSAANAPIWDRCSALLPLLAPLSWAYGRVALARRRRLEAASRRVDRPVISVGNITCGGTGKTPTVEMIARHLQELGRSPALLSRGYGQVYRRELGFEFLRSEGGDDAPEPIAGDVGNDEFHVLAVNLPTVRHFQGHDRYAIACEAIAAGADVLVLDDGFQHVRIGRDLDLVLIDAISPFGNGRVLPAGLLREPLEVLGRADMFGITRSDLVDTMQLSTLEAYLRHRFGSTPQVFLRTQATGWWSLAGEHRTVKALAGARALAFCGIGNPWAFQRQLRLLGVRVADIVCFRDHHRYTDADVDRLLARARELGVNEVLMTQKDAVKLRIAAGSSAAASWSFLKIEQEVTRGQAAYRAALARVLTAA